VAVDSSGDVYVVDYKNNRVLKLAAGTSTPVSLPFTGLNFRTVWRWIATEVSTSAT